MHSHWLVGYGDEDVSFGPERGSATETWQPYSSQSGLASPAPETQETFRARDGKANFFPAAYTAPFGENSLYWSISPYSGRQTRLANMDSINNEPGFHNLFLPFPSDTYYKEAVILYLNASSYPVSWRDMGYDYQQL